MDFIFIAVFLEWQKTKKEYYKIDGPEGLLKLDTIIYVQPRLYYSIMSVVAFFSMKKIRSSVQKIDWKIEIEIRLETFIFFAQLFKLPTFNKCETTGKQENNFFCKILSRRNSTFCQQKNGSKFNSEFY